MFQEFISAGMLSYVLYSLSSASPICPSSVGGRLETKEFAYIQYISLHYAYTNIEMTLEIAHIYDYKSFLESTIWAMLHIAI